ncbi:MAG: 3'-5' exonuclease [Proteobacteria bacterium]|nr:3'-5' exonuclease [Pseudomonadota bacterium]
MKWKHLPIVAFDTETTGLSPFIDDRIIEFAAVALTLDDEGRVADVVEHSWLINPERDIPPKVVEITGITSADVAGAPRFAEMADTIRDLLAGAVTVAHNYPFDLGFLTSEYARLDQVAPVPLAEIDTIDLSMKAWPDARGHKLSDVCKRLDVVLEGAHRATNDALACGKCFTELARRHDVVDELQEMLTWSRAIGRPPEDGPLDLDTHGRVVFGEGKHQGTPVLHHPKHLQWMLKARERGPDGWRFRFPESTRLWIRRWLDVRAAGRARSNPKGVRSEDWGLDSCIAVDRRARL